MGRNFALLGEMMHFRNLNFFHQTSFFFLWHRWASASKRSSCGLKYCPMLDMDLTSLRHPPHRYTLQKLAVLFYFACLFGKKLFSIQDNLVSNKQTHLRKQNFSETITPMDNSCMLLFSLSINLVVC